MSSPSTSPPRAVRVAAAVLLLQGAGAFAAGAVELVVALAGHPHDRGTASFLGVLAMVYGAVMVLVGGGVGRMRRWAGTPALMVEFFAVVIALGQLHTLLALSVVLLASAAAAFAALLHPDARAVLVRR